MSKPSWRAATVVVRSSALVAAAAAGGAGLLQLAGPPLREAYAAGPVSFEDALEALCAAVATLCWAWLALSALLVACSAVADAFRAHRLADLAGHASRTATPDLLRRLLLAGCGVALGAGAVVLPASAATQSAPARIPATVADLNGLALPDRQTGIRAEPSGWVTVRPGDSLWAIARRTLPPDADAQQISATWHRIAAANEAVLGNHPDLIHPGTRLRVPVHRRDAL
jgi:nucleoid-associated protein YgaU